MASLRDFIIAEFGKNGDITISWDQRELITFEDIAFISISDRSFVLDEQYYEHISYDDDSRLCNETDVLQINERFENYENVCLLFAILHEGCHTSIYHEVMNNEDGIGDGIIFGKEYVAHAWEYAIENDLGLASFGRIVRKLVYCPGPRNDSFIDRYLGKPDIKSARAKAAARKAGIM